MAALACPIPTDQYPAVTLAHGGGGRLMHQLIERMFAASFARGGKRGDAAILPAPAGPFAFTTDSFVVKPLFFPGGDIGRLAVLGTCNDLAVSGAEPLHLSLAMVIEEGLPMELLWQVCKSIGSAADQAGVTIVTGDTKVVERGKGDGLYLTATGIGLVIDAVDARRVRVGDAIIVSGDVGRHGIAVLAARGDIGLETDIGSDLASLWPAVSALHAAGIELRWMRDATRGGLATVLVELAEEARVAVRIEESAVPVTNPVQAACELLGFDPLYVANEGCMAVIVRADQAAAALATLRTVPGCGYATVIGAVVGLGEPMVTAKSPIGGERVLRMLSGEQLPRIC
jgi:hydrogenase expression/formation protein HypE